MALPDLSHVLKVSARLVDLHDSARSHGASPVYQGESRAGHGDGRYVALAAACLHTLHELGRRSGDEYSPLDLIAQQVRLELPWAESVDIEYVLNVLARPTELKLLAGGGSMEGYVISEKETHLTDKSANVAEYRLSRMGRSVLSMATSSEDEYQDIAYIEGDVTKLLRALESGRLKAALAFVNQLNEQLREAHTSLVSLIERGGRALRAAHDELMGHKELMDRTNKLVKSAEARITEIIQNDIAVDDEEVPIGLIRERVRELSGGIVRYSRQVSQLSAETSRGISSSINAPSFAALAQLWVTNPPDELRIDQVMASLGPTGIVGVTPTGTDFAGVIKPRQAVTRPLEQLDLQGYALPPEHEFIQWLSANRALIEAAIEEGGLSLEDAMAKGLTGRGADEAFSCLVTALAAVDSWTDMTGLAVSLHEALTRKRLPDMDVMFSGLTIARNQKPNENPTRDAE
jgi:hypothetical protein